MTLIILHGLYGKKNPNPSYINNTQDNPPKCIKYYHRNFFEETSI